MAHPAVNAVKAVKLGVADVAAVADFYEAIWGLTRAGRTADSALLKAREAAVFTLALQRWPKSEFLELSLGADDRNTIDALHARVVASGAAIHDAPAEGIGAPSEYGFSFEALGFRRISVSVNRQVDRNSDASSEGPLRISHVVLNTQDRAAAADFCQSVLGFRLCDQTRMMDFLSCNTDHHSLAFADGPTASLNHVAYEMESLDLLMRCAARVRDAGFPLEWGVGRHGPGNNIFAYFVDPAGFVCEYTTGMEQVGLIERAVGRPEDWDRFWRELGKTSDRWGLAPQMSQRLMSAMRGQ
jgi:catechol-2,3-dioxygenase